MIMNALNGGILENTICRAIATGNTSIRIDLPDSIDLFAASEAKTGTDTNARYGSAPEGVPKEMSSGSIFVVVIHFYNRPWLLRPVRDYTGQIFHNPCRNHRLYIYLLAEVCVAW